MPIELRAATHVSGSVRDTDGNAIEGALVEAAPHANATDSDAAWMAPLGARTDARGAFRIEGLPANMGVRLRLRAEGFQLRDLAFRAVGKDMEIELIAEESGSMRPIEDIQRDLRALEGEMAGAKSEAERKVLELMEELRRASSRPPK